MAEQWAAPALAGMDSSSTVGAHGLPTVAMPQPPSIYDTTNVQISQPRKGPRRPKREKIKVPRLPARAAIYPNAVIAAGGYHTAIVDIEGHLWTWGEGSAGQLGHPPRRADLLPDNLLVPHRVEALDGTRILAVSAGLAHTVCLAADQTVYSFGFARSWLGHGDWQEEELKHNVLIPRPITALKRVIRIACGWSHTLALCEDGSLFSWGDGTDGRLGQGHERHVAVPTKVEIEHPVAAMAAGAAHSAAVLEDGRVMTWGTGRPLGLGKAHTTVLTPSLVVHLSNFHRAKITYVSCGAAHTVALGSNGMVYTWGWGKCGQLGHGNREDRLLPSLIDSIKTKQILRVAAGAYHTILASEAGEILTFGAGGCDSDGTQIAKDGEEGRLGYGTVVEETDDDDDDSPLHDNYQGQRDQLKPKVLSGVWRLQAGSKPKNVAASGYHSVVSTEGGHVYVFGVGTKGRLGLGNEKPAYSPTPVESLRGVTVAGVALQDKSKFDATVQDSAAVDEIDKMSRLGFASGAASGS